MLRSSSSTEPARPGVKFDETRQGPAIEDPDPDDAPMAPSAQTTQLLTNVQAIAVTRVQGSSSLQIVHRHIAPQLSRMLAAKQSTIHFIEVIS